MLRPERPRQPEDSNVRRCPYPAFPPDARLRILEIGAGTANYTGALTASGLSVIALDRSPEMVEIGARKTSVRWILSDVPALPFRTRSLDAIAGVNVLHHLRALPATLAECKRVARLGIVL